MEIVVRLLLSLLKGVLRSDEPDPDPGLPVDLEDMERRLGARVPPSYRRHLEDTSAKDLRASGFDPKTLTVLTLQLWDSSPELARGKLFLTSDGCGNFWFMDLGSGEDRVHFLDHESCDVEQGEQGLADFLVDAVQENPVHLANAKLDHLAVCRTDSAAESILDPITLTQWQRAIEALPELEYTGTREFKNPFTGESSLLEVPGRARASLDDGQHDVQLIHGLIRCEDRPSLRRLAERVAAELGAKLRKTM